MYIYAKGKYVERESVCVCVCTYIYIHIYVCAGSITELPQLVVHHVMQDFCLSSGILLGEAVPGEDSHWLALISGKFGSQLKGSNGGSIGALLGKRISHGPRFVIEL